MTTPRQDDAPRDVVHDQVRTWRARSARVAAGQEPDLPGPAPDGAPFLADTTACTDARRLREILGDPRRRAALEAFAEAALVPMSAAHGAAAHPEAHAQLLAAGIDLTTHPHGRAPRRSPAPDPRARSGIAGLVAGLTDRVGTVTTRVVPHRTVARATLQVRSLLGGPADVVAGELDADVAALRRAGLGADVRLLGLPVVGPAGAEEYVAAVRRDLFGRDDLRSVTVAADAVAPEALGAAARAATAAPTRSARAQFTERLRPLLRGSREAGIDLVLEAPAGQETEVVAAATELALEPEFAYVTPFVALDAEACAQRPELIGAYLSAARDRQAVGGMPLGVRLRRAGAHPGGDEGEDRVDDAAPDALHRTLDELIVPETAPLLEIVVDSDRLEDHALAAALADARPGASAPRAHVSSLCPPERAWVLGQDLDLDVAVAAVAGATTSVAPEVTGGLLATATARHLQESVRAAGGEPHAAPGPCPAREPGEPVPGTAGAVAPGSPAGSRAARDGGADPLEVLLPEDLRELALAAREAGERWASVPASRRAACLDRAAADLDRAGAPEAAAAVRTHADGARRLVEAADGARFTPDRLVVVLPDPATVEVGAAAAAAAALAAGAAVLVLVPSSASGAAQRIAGVLRTALAEAGAPGGVLRVLPADDPPQALLELDEVDTVAVADPLLARQVEAWRASRPAGPRVVTGPAGPSAMIVTAAAQAEDAATDLVVSAFAGGGALPGSVSVAVLVGAAASSQRLRDAIVDAVAALPSVLPRAEETPELQRARALDTGESWLVAPRRVGEDGPWTAAVKSGVAAGSHTATVRLQGPVLGLLEVTSLEDAVRIANAGRGLVTVCWSTDPEECRLVTEASDAPHVVLRRPSIGGVAPADGAAAAAGGAGWDTDASLGPDVAGRLGHWDADETPSRREEPADPVRAALIDYTGLVRDQEERSWLRGAVASDAHAWARALVRIDDTAGTGPDVVLLRRRTADPVWVRAGEGTTVVELVRVLLAAETVGARPQVSLAPPVSTALKTMDALGEPARQGLRRLTPLVDRVEDISSFAARIRSGTVTGRIRVLGTEADVLSGMVAGRGVELAADPVHPQGSLELRAFLRGRTLTRPRGGAGGR